MKNIVCIVAGLMLLICSVIVPFPTIMGISGIVWRVVVGLLGCILLALGSYQTAKRRKMYKSEQ